MSLVLISCLKFYEGSLFGSADDAKSTLNVKLMQVNKGSMPFPLTYSILFCFLIK